MTLEKIVKHCIAPLLVLWAPGASAHDGHGMTGSHWHASDAWGFVAVAAIVAVAVWLSRDDE